MTNTQEDDLKKETNLKLDKLFIATLMIYSIYDKTICPICKIEQGVKHKGWRKYYCKHLGKKIDNILSPIENEIKRSLK